ncbi:two-component system response regulator YesN [Hydrogenispora ethanolica]|uniref:Two-component system response regulator YesN n=1 Tax=Hydrogenispora ethanolica TaxID=1082276 RepID=A0A4R1RVW1_HYDET|nr:response regulator [Hydrogenispora ethanolica]TCL70798.1 two-component system response regulator YesN [Hydrogenispora ethanolica]
MVKVVIIDDEPLVRVGLRSMIPWEELGYELSGEATNGRQGLELIGKQQPDIVITDIKMPVMDGLEMMRLVLKAEQPVKFIILSSYDEFQLVKQAMKQGAEEYLIKLDLEPEVLTETLAAVREKLLAERGRSDQEERLEKGLRENLELLREGFFQRLLSKPAAPQAELSEQAAYLGIDLDELLACALIRINLNNPAELEKYDANELHVLESSIHNTINEIVNDIFKGYTFVWNPGEFIVIFSAAAGLANEAYRKKAVGMGERLAQMIKQYFNIGVSVGISDPHQGFTELSRAYFESCRAVQQSYYSGAATVLCFADVPQGESDQAQIDMAELKTALPKAIELLDLELIGAAFEMVFNLLNEPKLSREQAYDLCFQIAYLINGALNVSEAELKEIIGYRNSLYESILTLNTLAELGHWLTGLERRLCRFISQTDEQKNHRLVAKAKRYILDHYREEISLNEVAAAISISPGYLSTIFRQDTGICFTDYVTEAKIGQAKKWLRESDYKIYEISALLGYQNAYYFSKVFKKVTGMTPSEFSGKKL